MNLRTHTDVIAVLILTVIMTGAAQLGAVHISRYTDGGGGGGQPNYSYLQTGGEGVHSQSSLITGGERVQSKLSNALILEWSLKHTLFYYFNTVYAVHYTIFRDIFDLFPSKKLWVI